MWLTRPAESIGENVWKMGSWLFNGGSCEEKDEERKQQEVVLMVALLVLGCWHEGSRMSSKTHTESDWMLPCCMALRWPRTGPDSAWLLLWETHHFLENQSFSEAPHGPNLPPQQTLNWRGWITTLQWGKGDTWLVPALNTILWRHHHNLDLAVF